MDVSAKDEYPESADSSSSSSSVVTNDSVSDASRASSKTKGEDEPDSSLDELAASGSEVAGPSSSSSSDWHWRFEGGSVGLGPRRRFSILPVLAIFSVCLFD